MAFTIKKGDTLPVLQAALTTGPSAVSQAAVDLSTATAVVLVMKSVSGGAASRLTATAYDKPNGLVQYTWAAGDTSTSGSFNAEWEVTFGAGKIQTFPNDQYFTITVSDDLG